MTQELGILITCYDQSELVRDNIERIRKRYKQLCNIPIIIVSTSENPDPFEKLSNEYNDVHFLDFSNAPGSKNSTIRNKKNPAGEYRSWRHEFLPMRILLSMQKGINYAWDIGIQKILHLHSDTYFDERYEDVLVQLFQHLDSCMMIADTSTYDEDSAAVEKTLPPTLHLHPEGLFLNLAKCQECGYGFTFQYIFTENSEFATHNYGSIESLIGLYLIYCLTGKNILKYTDEIPSEYHQNIYLRLDRPYHGKFIGLVNLPGKQQDAQ